MIELLALLTTWRLSSLLVNEAGPFDIFGKLRYLVGVRYDEHSNCLARGLSGAFCCIWCMSVWVGLVIAILIALYRGDHWLIAVLDWLGFSAGAIVINKVMS